MSNSNNPFLPYLTEENKNENNNQNNDKANSDISKILEETSSTAVPPPAYEDVVKPQPTQPSYIYQSYPPPPFPPPVAENYNQNIQTSDIYANSNKSERGCFSNRNKSCSCGWAIAFLIFAILGTISLVNNNLCNNLKFGDNPNTFFFNNTDGTTLQFNVDNLRVKHGEVRISNNVKPGDSQSIKIDVFTGSNGVTPKFDTFTSPGVYELKISQIGGFSLFNIPPRCMKFQINVLLPTLLAPTNPIPSTIKAENLNFMMEPSYTIIPYQQNVTLITRDGDIRLNGIDATSVNIITRNGDIHGSIKSLSDELSITTEDGDTNLILGNANSPFNPTIKINSDDGDVVLGFGGSFSGNYELKSKDGSIKTDADNTIGKIGNGNGNLNVLTDDGDIIVSFNNKS